MVRALHAEHAFSDRFITSMLSRNIRIEEDLVDQLFNSSEKRLARTLLLPDEIRLVIGLPRGATLGDAVALAQAWQAIKGETTATKEMRDAIEGRTITPPDSEGKNAATQAIIPV